MSEGSIDTRSQDGITVITLNRPAKRNAMTAAMCADLRSAFETFRDGTDRVAVLTAAGDIFTAGADLTSPPSQFWKALPDVGVNIGKPVIAALNGPCIGLGVAIVPASCALMLPPRVRLRPLSGLQRNSRLVLIRNADRMQDPWGQSIVALAAQELKALGESVQKLMR